MKRLVLLLLLAGCAAPVAPPAPAPVARDLSSCAAEPYRNLVGQPATALERVLIMRQVRLLRPDTMVTMDFRPERINFSINASGVIDDVYCG